jgi:hypothetical protein
MSFSFHRYQSELFPTRIRSRAICPAYSWRRLSAALSGLVVAFLLNLGGVNAGFAFIAFAMAIVVATIGGSGPHPWPRARALARCLKGAMTSSFRGAGEAREPGIQKHGPEKSMARPVFMDSGSGPEGPSRNDTRVFGILLIVARKIAALL